MELNSKIERIERIIGIVKGQKIDGAIRSNNDRKLPITVFVGNDYFAKLCMRRDMMAAGHGV